MLIRLEIYAEPRKRLPELVVTGRDGLIVTRGPYSGLLLLQVAGVGL